MAGGERVHAAKVLSAPVAAHWSRMINGCTWPNPHLALTASGDKSEALVRDGVCSALQGQGLTPTETLEENGLNIHSRQADSAFDSWMWKCERCVKTQLRSWLWKVCVFTGITHRGVTTASIYGIAHHEPVREALTSMSLCHTYLSGSHISQKKDGGWSQRSENASFCRLTWTLFLTSYGLNMDAAELFTA